MFSPFKIKSKCLNGAVMPTLMCPVGRHGEIAGRTDRVVEDVLSTDELESATGMMETVATLKR